MKSAFGVVHKSYSKLAPKLAAAEAGLRPKGNPKGMLRKLRYIKGRQDIGASKDPKIADRIKTQMKRESYRKTNEPTKRVLP